MCAQLTVPRRRGQPLVPHDRSSVRRLLLGWAGRGGGLAGLVALALGGGPLASLSAQAAPPTPPARPDTTVTPDAKAAAARELRGSLDDLGLSMNATLESKLERLKNDRCTTSQRTILGNNCRGTFLPNFNFQFDARSNGSIGNRVFLDVDYDSKREFDGANNLALRYQGKPNQRLQSVEIGNVTFQTPASRFLTSGIPSGNYGVQAKGKLGAMSFSGIAAQQKGTVSRDNLYTVGARTEQQVERTIEDVQLEQRRLFFTIDPRQLGGFPNIDLLNRQQMRQLAAALPDSLRPARLYVYRQYIGAANQNPRGPQFSVRGARNPSRQIYEVLRENVDYYVDPSQLWIALVRPLSPSTERLAVAYEVNVNGVPGRNLSAGGTPDIEFTDAPQFANLLWEPELQPSNAAYFLREIKSAYRLGGAELERESLALRVVTGTSGDQEKPIDPSRGETYLKLFGLAAATNPAAFDVENRVWPRPNDPNFRAAFSGGEQQRLIPDYFVIFPSLQPFARTGLAQPIANPANDTLYRYPNEYFNTAQRPQAIYRLVLRYTAGGDDNTQAVQLPSTLVRQNSERVLLEGRPLRRDLDYTINYDIGLITFNRPDTLFAVPRQVSVRFEENPQFQTTPTTVLGFNSQFPLDNGQLSFTAISQRQNTAFTRPTLGLEPLGSLVAGMTGTMQWDATALSKALGKLPFAPSAIPSRIALQGEFAMSKPQPNSAGQAYLESFEGQSEVSLPIADASWYFGSRPALGNALSGLATSVFALNRASTLAYQNFGVTQSGSQLQFNITQIDPSVRFVGSGVQPAERLLWMTLYPLAKGGVFDVAPGTTQRRFAWTIGSQSRVGPTPSGRRWRALRTVLNPSGADLSRMENIEFYVLVQSEQAKLARNPTLVLDFGEVSENSVTFAPETLTINAPARPGLKADSTYRGKRLVGFDRLDSERDPFSRAFNAAENDRGLSGHKADTLVVVDRTGAAPTTTVVNSVTLCTQSAGAVQALGDSRANCTAGNNLLDEEDLDLDGQLNGTAATVEQESLKRFVVDLSDKRSWTRTGRCFQQQDSTAGIAGSDSLCWVQVRLNWRAPTELINSPNDRRLRTLRLTMLSNAAAADSDFVRVALARFRLVGAPWLKRSAEPLSGVAGDSSGTVGGYVIAGVVGTLDSTAVLPYSAPPGVVEAPDSKQTGYEATRTQVNERALRLQAGLPGRQFRVFDRAEAFYRFPNGTQTFMGYRTLRLWMRGRGNGWGAQGELNGFVKIGRDENNFYMYRTPVNTGASQSAWLPEVRVDLSRFQVLRAQLENAFLQGSGDSLACSGADLELVKRSGKPRGVNVRRYAVCQDGYIVYSADPAVTPPNLAGVQELAVGLVRMDSVSRGGTGIMANDTLELWINDVRLTDVVDDLGFAGELGVSVNAGDFADLRLNLSRRDPNFRQLGETPTFLTTSGVSLGTTVHLERFLPARLGLSMPFSVDYNGTGIEQLFVNRSDVRASGIDNLRNPRDRRTSYAFAVRRATPLEKGWYAPVVNALALNGMWSNAGTQSTFQEATANSYRFGGGLVLGSEVRESRLPRLLTRLADVLPRRWRESARVAQWKQQQVRWSPTQFRLNSSVVRTANTTTSFTKAASIFSDTGEVVSALTHVWANTGALEFRPVSALMASVNARQLLDVRDYRDPGLFPDSLDRGAAASSERVRLIGADLGLERERSVNSVVAFQPQLAGWLRPRVDFTSTFALNKDPNARVLLRSEDSTGAYRLPRRLGAAQSLNLGSVFDLNRLMAMVTREKSAGRRLGALLAPIDVQWQQSLTSNYDNTAYIPGWGYQFGIGGLDAFRGANSRLATTAGRLQRTTLQGALNLPLSLTLQTRLEQGTTETWTRRTVDGFQAVITSTQRVRPDYRLSWSWRPTLLRKLVSIVTVNGRYLVSEQETTIPNELGGLADQSRTVARSRPLSASITWSALGNLVTNASVDRQRREELRPGSVTQGDTRRLSFDVQRTLRLPKRWNTRDGLLRTSASYQTEEALSEVNGTARFTGAMLASAPSVLTNSGRRAYNLNASTDLSDLLTFNVTGAQIVSFDRNVNRQLSSLVLSTVLQIRFFSGALR
jgi:cell surface protein SprA